VLLAPTPEGRPETASRRARPDDLQAPACHDPRMSDGSAKTQSPPRVVLTCGEAGSGKTTYAKELEARGYVRRSIDEELWRRFGRFGVDYHAAEYDLHAATSEANSQRSLIELVRAGRDVVVDSVFGSARHGTATPTASMRG
jgi:AAA domain-containing protein